MYNPGDKIGRYTLVQFLGKGGEAEVWLAERGLVPIRCALKISLSHLNEGAVKSEAAVWNQAGHHENIVPIQDVSEEDGRVVIATDYHPDGNLKQWLDRNGGITPSIEAAINMILGILKGLDHLHSREPQIIHRDLKPSNILLQGERARIADFGLARLTDQTLSGNTLGTIPYMAPEAFDTKKARVIETDIWAVGVIFYQLVTGGLPYTQIDTIPLMNAILTEDPEPLPESVPKMVRDIIMHALEKEPAQRYRSAGEMIRDVKGVLHVIQEIKTSLKAGDDHLDKGEYDLAIPIYDELIKLRPDCVEAYQRAGKAHRLRGDKDGSVEDWNEAIKDFTRVIDILPDDPEAYFNRGAVYAAKQDWNEAIKDYQKAIDLNPGEAQYYFYLGKVYDGTADYAEAVANYERAISLGLKDKSVYLNRAYSFKMQIELLRFRAIDDFETALELSKDDTEQETAKIQTQLRDLRNIFVSNPLENSGPFIPPKRYRLMSYVALSLTGVICLLIFALFYEKDKRTRTEQKVSEAEQRANTADALRVKEVDRKTRAETLIAAFHERGRDLKQDVWWVAEVENRTDSPITINYTADSGGSNATLQPNGTLIIWRKQSRPEVEFDYSPQPDYQKRSEFLTSYPVFKNAPNDSDKSNAIINYFDKNSDGEIDLHFDMFDKPSGNSGVTVR